ncbi:hypothetical protein FJY63_08835, partial [Candidatus Sumerlaeota bacterium]|nr:hypothetical protein [Candidatus Sumerlaeota bacterium]
ERPSTESKSSEQARDSGGDEEPLFPIRGYVLLNVLFWLFCAVEVLIVRLWLKEIQGVFFFFGLLAIGFTVVSIYECVHDRLTARSNRAQGS